MNQTTTATGSDRTLILEQLKQCLGQVIGDDAVAVLDIDERTSVWMELGLSSLDMLRLVEAVNEHYPVAEQLVGWVSGLPTLKLRRLTVGDIVGFIADALR